MVEGQEGPVEGPVRYRLGPSTRGEGTRREAEIDREVDRLIAGGHPSFDYLAVFDLVSWLSGGRQAVGLEALARFELAVNPALVFARARAQGRGVDLELAVLRSALRDLERIPDDAYLSVNLSAASVESPEFGALLEAGQPDRMVVEISQREVMRASGPVEDALWEPRRRGLRLAVDDVQADVEGISEVLVVEPDLIKLDVAVVGGLEHDPARRRLLPVMAALAGTVGAQLLAEGVYHPRLVARLVELGIRYGQGFGLHRPQRLVG